MELIIHQTSSSISSLIGAYVKVFGLRGCFESRCPLISCRRILRSRCWLSVRRVPTSTIASPSATTWSVINLEVGFIFIFSVQKRNELLGTGYPFPITQLQKVSSSCGVVVTTCIGIICSRAASPIFRSTVETYSSMTGFSTIVSLQTTYTRLRKGFLSSLNSCIAIQVSIRRTVESLPPEKPIIHGRQLMSASMYWSFSSSIIARTLFDFISDFMLFLSNYIDS